MCYLNGYETDLFTQFLLYQSAVCSFYQSIEHKVIADINANLLQFIDWICGYITDILQIFYRIDI